MFCRKESSVESLPEEIKNFVKQYKLKLINPYGQFAGGIDGVFDFLAGGVDPSFYNCALANMKNDQRFTNQMRNELRAIVSGLTEGFKNNLPQPKQPSLEQKEFSSPKLK